MSIDDLSVLSSLENLIKLNLSNTDIDDLRPLRNLSNLKELDFSESSIPYFPFELLFLPKLSEVNLQNTHCLNLPSELIHDDNALPYLRNYYSELQKKTHTYYHANLITLGNSRVGKTSLIKTLFNLGSLDDSEVSTHGVQIIDAEVSLPFKEVKAKLSLWDFGRQELYLATYRIFMKSSALYLLVWDSHTERTLGEEPINMQSLPFGNYPLSYWLDNIRALSPHAKIIVICNKSDEGVEHFPEHLQALQTRYKIDSFLSVSAQTGYNLSGLYHRIQHLLEQMPEMGMPMPVSWKNVQDKLAAIENQPYINFASYAAICTEEDLSEGSAYTLLRFLHHSGFVFWYEKYLRDQIVLDQKWAMKAIYQLLDRNGWYALLKGNGLRKYSDLALCWKEFTPAQVKVFLEMMQSCELALKLGNKNDLDPTYLIPEFLPDHPATAVTYAWDAATSPVYYFRFQHHFLHVALMQRFIIHSAKLAESYDLLWRTGILIKVEGTLARIEIFPEEFRIEIQVRGPKPAELIQRLKNELSKTLEIKEGDVFLLSITGHPDEWVSLEQVEQHLSIGKTYIASTTGEILEIAPFQFLTHITNHTDENAPLSLRELADRESGAQLLERTNTSNLISFKTYAKTNLVRDIEAAFQYLQDKIQPASESFNILILLKGRWKESENQKIAGIVRREQNQISENQIRHDLLVFINNLKEEEIKL